MTEEKPKTRSSHQKEEATSLTSGVFALLDVYLTKMLVGHQDNLGNLPVTCVMRDFQAGPGFGAVLWRNSPGLKSTSCFRLFRFGPEGGSIALISKLSEAMKRGAFARLP